MKCPIIAHRSNNKRNTCQIEHKTVQTNTLAFRGNIFSLRGSKQDDISRFAQTMNLQGSCSCVKKPLCIQQKKFINKN